MKIWKYPLIKEANEYGDVELEMPKEAVILTVQARPVMGGMLGPLETWAPCIWALVDPEAETEIRRFRIMGTGHELPNGIYHVHGKKVPNGYFDDHSYFAYIGTFYEGIYVWHLFERP